MKSPGDILSGTYLRPHVHAYYSHGPTATGKSSVARTLAACLPRCALVEYDDVHRMFVKPHVPPWLPEGKHQQILGVERVCDIAKRLLVDSYDVVIADVLSDDTARLYRKRLADFEPRIVQLLPSFEIVRERFYARGPVLTDEEFEFVYREQELFTDYDIRIDNSGLSPDEAVVEILS